MTQRYAVSVIAFGLVLVLSGQAKADVSLQYLGAFRAFDGTPQIYGGGMALNPAGNGGAGSLLVARGWLSGDPEVYEVTMPSLVNSADVNALNTAATLSSFGTNTAPHGMVLRSTDNTLYYSAGATGYMHMEFRANNVSGTAESTNRDAPAWDVGGFALTQIPDAWATAHTGGKNILTVGPIYGARISAVDPWNASVTDTPILEYDYQHGMNGYEYGDLFNGIAWVDVGGSPTLIVSGKDVSTSQAMLWLYRVSDIENAGQLYDPQPYQTLVVDDKLFTTGHTLYGLTYDAANHILYGMDGEWNQPTVVQAWLVVPEPATLTLLAFGALTRWRRRA